MRESTPCAETGSPSSPAEPFIIPLANLDPDRDANRVGKKGSELGRLMKLGLPVPDGFCLTTAAYRAFVERLPPELREMAGGQGLGGGEQGSLSPSHLPSALAPRPLTPDAQPPPPDPAARLAVPMPEAVRHALLDAYQEMGGGLVAVRSSGTMEDLPGASFAGQYETTLGVAGAEALVAAVQRCWASVWSERVLSYCRRNGIAPSDLAMAVVIQRMVDAEAAGVLYTINPLTGREEEALIESAWGLGELVVSGRVNPDRFVVAAETGHLLERSVGAKARRLRCGPAGLIEEDVRDDERGRATLTDEQLRRLVELGQGIQAAVGTPQDIEWAVGEGGRLTILQARPITRIRYAPGYGEWTTADFRDGGVSASVVSPFMWSLYEHIFQQSLPAYLKQIRLLPPALARGTVWARVFFGRPYWNVGAVKQCLATLPGFIEREFDTDLSIGITYAGNGLTVPVTLRGVLRALPTLFALERGFRQRLRANEALRRSFPPRARAYRERDLAALPMEELCRAFRSLVDRLFVETESAYFLTVYQTSNAKLAFKQRFDAVNGRAGCRFSDLKLMSGLQDLSHGRAVAALWEIAAAIHADAALCRAVIAAEPASLPALLEGSPQGEELRRFIAAFGYHGTKELDITCPRWHEQPEFVYEALRKTVAEFAPDRDPGRLNERQHESYRQERRQLEAFLTTLGSYRWLPGRRRTFLGALERLRRFCWWREEMRDLSSQVYDLIRRHAVEIGRRWASAGVLPDGDAILMLTYREIYDLSEGRLAPGEAQRRVARNRRYGASFRNFANPNEIGERYTYQPRPSTADDGPPAAILVGVPCSPGLARGTARLIRSPEEAHRVAAGEVLVTTYTDPGWTPLLSRVSAVVTETGGLLSHAAVIAREYGLAAVLAVPEATRRIPDGATVRVDGDRGIVTIEA